MKIVYDNIIYSLQNAGGISNYWFQLSYRILKNGLDISFIQRKNSNNIYIKDLSKYNFELGLNNQYPLLIDRFLDLDINYSNKFIFHSSYNRITNNKYAIQIVTIHDLIHEKYYKGLRKILHTYQKKKAIKCAKHIITVSQNTKNDLLRHYPYIDETNISVIYNGVSDDFKYQNEQYENFILYVGSREIYKNFHTIVKLLANFNNYRFVIIGSQLNKTEYIFLNKYLSNRWEIQIGISNKKLNDLYNKAFALLYPSSYEGFGIPLLEAMKAGCPFIALNNSSIPEVAGEAGILLNELTIDSLNHAFSFIESNRELLQSRGFFQSDRFSWDKTYIETISLYKKLINEDINNNCCL